jgi:hypothetical protein
VLRRRWYVFAPCLLVFALLAVFLVGQVKPSYKASGTMFLSRPASDPASTEPTATTTVEGGDKGANPIADMDRLQALNIMAEIATDSNFKDEVIAAGGSGNYVVAPPFANTPSLLFSTTAASPERTMADYRVLVEVFQQEVLKRHQAQQRVPAERSPHQGRHRRRHHRVPRGDRPVVPGRLDARCPRPAARGRGSAWRAGLADPEPAFAARRPGRHRRSRRP